jgi:hypothetical protein
MSLRQRSQLVGFDAEEATEYLLEEAGDDLLVVAEYTPEEYRLLYVGDDLESMYGSTDDVVAAADSIHEYIDLDFRERDMFLDLYPTIENVDGLVTVADSRSVARVLSPDDEGLYFSVPLDVAVMELLQDVVGIVDRTA